jgi:hypothetical protein
MAVEHKAAKQRRKVWRAAAALEAAAAARAVRAAALETEMVRATEAVCIAWATLPSWSWR